MPIVAPRGSRPLLRRFSDVREVEVGEDVRFGDVVVTATPAVHTSRRVTLRSTESVGYVVAGSRRIYFAGDTDLFDGMADLAGSLDVALIPVAGWGSKVGVGHLDPERAARALQLLKPRLAVPIHWGTLSLVRARDVVGTGGDVQAARVGARARRGRANCPSRRSAGALTSTHRPDICGRQSAARTVWLTDRRNRAAGSPKPSGLEETRPHPHGSSSHIRIAPLEARAARCPRGTDRADPPRRLALAREPTPLRQRARAAGLRKDDRARAVGPARLEDVRVGLARQPRQRPGRVAEVHRRGARYGRLDRPGDPQGPVGSRRLALGHGLPRLGAALAGRREPVVLVLDNVHVLEEQRCLDALLALALHVPVGSQLVFSGRIEPRSASSP